MSQTPILLFWEGRGLVTVHPAGHPPLKPLPWMVNDALRCVLGAALCSLGL